MFTTCLPCRSIPDYPVRLIGAVSLLPPQPGKLDDLKRNDSDYLTDRGTFTAFFYTFAMIYGPVFAIRNH